MQAYLFVHFTGTEENESDEQVYFSVSRDSIAWKDLRPRPILRSGIGDKGARDPFIIRAPEGDHFYIIATDLSIHQRGGWSNSGWQSSSTSMLVWESADLVRWSEPRLADLAGGIPGAGNLWAPEAIYDEAAGDYFVFWATYTKASGQNDMYCARTRDFRSFTKPTLWMKEAGGVIDASVIRAGDLYYRASRAARGIRIDRCISLTGEWEALGTLQGIFAGAWDCGAVEGPALFLYNKGDWLNGRPTWGLFVDQYKKRAGYKAFRTTDISDMSQNSWFAAEGVDFGPQGAKSSLPGRGPKRHGSILPITSAEYDRLAASFQRSNPILPGRYADPDVIIAGSRYYLYPTTDGFPGWGGWQFRAFSSEDMLTWREEGVILDLKADVPWSGGSAWAPAIAEKNGRFYFYFCGSDITNPGGQKKAIGVAVGDSPTGPFKAMPKPLITLADCERAGVRMWQAIDPYIYAEEGVSYLLFGNGAAAIARLGEDMVSWAPGTLRNIEGAHDIREAPAVHKIEGKYHFTWSCDDTGSEDYLVRYGIAECLFGPIRHEGVLLQKDKAAGILGTGHHAILHHPARDEYYIFYHRFLTPPGQKLNGGPGCNREICIDKLEYRHGKFRPVKPTNAGIQEAVGVPNS